MGMVVAKLIRLTDKSENGEFKNSKEGKITVRKRVIIDRDSVTETEDNYKQTGLLYVVDETATLAREKEVDAEVKEARRQEKEGNAPAAQAPVAPAAPAKTTEAPAKDPGAKAIKEADTSKAATDNAAKNLKDENPSL